MSEIFFFNLVCADDCPVSCLSFCPNLVHSFENTCVDDIWST